MVFTTNKKSSNFWQDRLSIYRNVAARSIGVVHLCQKNIARNTVCARARNAMGLSVRDGTINKTYPIAHNSSRKDIQMLEILYGVSILFSVAVIITFGILIARDVIDEISRKNEL